MTVTRQPGHCVVIHTTGSPQPWGGTSEQALSRSRGAEEAAEESRAGAWAQVDVAPHGGQQGHGCGLALRGCQCGHGQQGEGHRQRGQEQRPRGTKVLNSRWLRLPGKAPARRRGGGLEEVCPSPAGSERPPGQPLNVQALEPAGQFRPGLHQHRW